MINHNQKITTKDKNNVSTTTLTSGIVVFFLEVLVWSWLIWHNPDQSRSEPSASWLRHLVPAFFFPNWEKTDAILYFIQLSEGFGTFQTMPQQLKQNKANKVHLGYGFSIFLHTITQHLWIQVDFLKNVIFHKESAAWLCAFPLKYCNFCLKRVQ